ncbi:MAG TPA: hypothetical protein VM266_05360 [Solirubrobacteraceae bacterium]|nr:hypothetical protein [Solirubrobacteraceae bacterium]
MRTDRVHKRRQAAALGVLAVVVAGGAIALAGGGDEPPARAGARATPEPKRPELPGGGRTILPGKRVVAFYGNPADDELGVLGIGRPDAAARKLLRQAKAYDRPKRPVLPAMELISTVATFDAGPDGLYRRHERNATIRRYLRAARRIGALLVLDIQPGRADFFEETTRLERWLREPDVGLALDPEWRVADGQVPGQVIGSVTVREVNAVSAWLDQLTARHDLPQKLLVLHQFTFGMIQDRDGLQQRDNVAIVINADGFGSREVKSAKYEAFQKGTRGLHEGFKLFYREDLRLMRPRQVLRLRPSPDFVVYE